MKRNKFLVSMFTLLAIPTFGSDRKKYQKKTPKGFKVKASEGKSYGHLKLKGVNANILDLKISGNDTDGAMAIFEQTSLSQGKGTPLHKHVLQDEVFYVVEGTYYFQVGEDKFDLTSGETIFLPRNVPHVWTQVSAKGKMVVTFQPAGKMENFFVSVANLDHEPSAVEMAKIFTDNEMKIVGPPLSLNHRPIKSD